MTVAMEERMIPRHRWPTIDSCDQELERLRGPLTASDIFDAQIARMACNDVLDRRLELMAVRDAAAAAGAQSC